jgi:hypothetical protein
VREESNPAPDASASGSDSTRTSESFRLSSRQGGLCMSQMVKIFRYLDNVDAFVVTDDAVY